MKLEILVPRYTETLEDITPLLQSIQIQQNVDFDSIGVIICNDGTESIDIPTDNYSFSIQQFECEKQGVSATRNECLDRSTADYVMFCDADDMFYSVNALWMIFLEAENSNFDTLVSCFMEETRDPATKKPIYIPREMDSTFVHGKVHRRQYLIEKNIRWNKDLTIHEDSYFNILAQSCVTDPNKAKYCPMPFYLWKWRDQSVCRHDPKYILKTFNNMLDSNTALIAELNRRNQRDKAAHLCVMMVFDSYYTMNKPDWIQQENQEYRDAVECRFYKYFVDHKAIWDGVSEQDKMMISAQVRNRSVMEGMTMEQMTIMQWIDSIRSKYGNTN